MSLLNSPKAGRLFPASLSILVEKRPLSWERTASQAAILKWRIPSQTHTPVGTLFWTDEHWASPAFPHAHSTSPMPLAACGHSLQILHSQQCTPSERLAAALPRLSGTVPTAQRVALFPKGQSGPRGGCVGRQELGTSTGKNAWGLGSRLCLPYQMTNPGNEAPSLPPELLRSGEVVLGEGLL